MRNYPKAFRPKDAIRLKPGQGFQFLNGLDIQNNSDLTVLVQVQEDRNGD